jgi:hypothetical protein
MQCSVFHVQSDDTDTLAILHEQVERKVFDEEVGVVSKRLTVQGVENGVTRSIGGGGTSVCLTTLAVLEGLTTERSLVDLSFLGSGEGYTVMFKLDNSVWCFLAHVVNRILVTQPITTLDGIVHVPPPIIFRHVSECGVDTTLRSDGVRTGREELGNTCGLESCFCETECCSETCTTGTDNNSIEFVVDYWVSLMLTEASSFSRSVSPTRHSQSPLGHIVEAG